MEMMNINAAIRMLGNYTNLLTGTRQMVLHTSNRIDADPEVAAHINSLQNNFEELLRDAAINVTVLREEMTRQIPVLLNFPAELAKLMQTLNTFDHEMNESTKAVSHIAPPTHLDPEPNKRPSTVNDP
jgi:hypothetical protein